MIIAAHKDSLNRYHVIEKERGTQKTHWRDEIYKNAGETWSRLAKDRNFWCHMGKAFVLQWTDQWLTNIYIYIYIYIYTHTNIYICTHTHTHPPTCPPTPHPPPPHTHTSTYCCTYLHKHTLYYLYTHIYLSACLLAYNIIIAGHLL